MILILGATGVVGRETVRLLTGRGLPVAAVTRNRQAVLPAGAFSVHPDEIPDLAEVRAVLLSPRAAGPAAAGVLTHARRAGARRIVVLSSVTVPHPAGEPRFREQFQAAEELAVGSGLDWTVLRCADFAANTLAWAGQIRGGDIVRGAYAQARTSTVDERDIAAVAALALAGPDHAGRTYLLTGPQSLSQPDKVATLGAVLGRPLTFAEVTPDAIRGGMIAAGLPAEVPDRLLGSQADYARAAGPAGDDVCRVLGRPARTYATWAEDHRAAFAGS
ncbi:NAD(P)H-binding protein [Actinoplanes sp. NPDC026670]|uniref:NAD(P)H-binding protein n=1 Tax=Actinoplanes sp. NPDC026670 TaxID=3154700 RepID=UPI0033C3EF5F